ncbi:AAA family ATPase [Streptomyces sp. NPDC050448]|uniref:AAA family ATPase n=1 Tax=Streptomyces sp. NPDC050448 TaxID=3155404 RepID=UPI003418E200
MIIWVNGASGAGKSTLAAGLRAALSGSVVTNPEDVGTLLRQSLAGHPRRMRDYQDYPAWRRLSVQFIAEVHQLTKGPVIVPMSVLDQTYVREMFGPLAELGTPFHHVVLHASPDPLEARIAASWEYPGDRERSEAVRAHRRRRATDYQEAAATWLPGTASQVIDTSHLTSEQTLQAVLTRLPLSP